MADDVNIDKKWHGAFYEAIKLELIDYKDLLRFISEFQLSAEALRMDLLVIKKDADTKIEKNIGKIFRGHNIFEYKSETDYIAIDDFYKVCAYALLYKVFEKADLNDITITFSETRYPRDLIKHLRNERGYRVTEHFEGIYYVEGDLFPIQVIENKKLSAQDNIWLRNLRSNLNSEDINEIFKRFYEQGDKDGKNAYISKIIEANKKNDRGGDRYESGKRRRNC